MLGWILRLIGMRAVGRVVGKREASGAGRSPAIRALDIGFGFALFRDRRVPVAAKGLALIVGGLLVSLLISLEVPVELLVAGLLNLLGAGMDIAIDGLEMLVGPVLLGALLLVHLAPREIVERIRGERYGVPVQPGHSVAARPLAIRR
jgi:hypothetical protein